MQCSLLIKSRSKLTMLKEHFRITVISIKSLNIACVIKFSFLQFLYNENVSNDDVSRVLPWKCFWTNSRYASTWNRSILNVYFSMKERSTGIKFWNFGIETAIVYLSSVRTTLNNKNHNKWRWISVRISGGRYDSLIDVEIDWHTLPTSSLYSELQIAPKKYEKREKSNRTRAVFHCRSLHIKIESMFGRNDDRSVV